MLRTFVSRSLVMLPILAAIIGGGSRAEGTPSATAFFRPGPEAPADLPADRLYPQGRIFPYTGFSGNVGRDKANYFSGCGPVYSNYDGFLREAAEHEMPALYPIGLPMNFLERGGEPALDLSSEEIAARIRAQVEAVMHEETIAWWYLTPEELRFWRQAEMDYLETVVRTIREVDPRKRPVWMYEPNHRTAGALAHIAPHLGVVGKGMYPNYAGQREHRIWCRWTIEQQIEAIEQTGANAIPIAVPEMFQQPPEGLAGRVSAWVRHDVYLSLISGARGVVIFSLAQRRNFPAHGDYYEAYAGIARELNGELNLGQVFLFGEGRSDIRVEVTAGPGTVSPKVGSGGIKEEIEYSSVNYLDLAYRSGRYLFLVNSADEPVTIRVSGIPSGRVVMQDLFQGRSGVANGGSFLLPLGPYEVRAIRFDPRG